ncbi:MAG: DUF975 family protein [Oscillospiraceae bacterium]|nr:DUF975 family protein [Oscillospiraceae bacterium]
MLGSHLKANARKLMLDNAPRIYFVTALYVILLAVLSYLRFRLPGDIDLDAMYTRLSLGELPSLSIIYVNFRQFGVFLALLLFIFTPVLEIGYMGYCLKIKRKQQTQFKDIFNGFLYFFKVIKLFLLIVVFILLWGLLLIIPGIVAAYRYRLAYYIFLDDSSKSALSCIRESSAMMFGSKVDLLIIDLSFIGWYILDVIITFLNPLPIGIPIVTLWLTPYMTLTRAGFYEHKIGSLAA